jgi:hypothetical protein
MTLKPDLNILTYVLAAVVVIAGAVVTILHQSELPFHDYVQDIAIVAGALGIGAGIARMKGNGQ